MSYQQYHDELDIAFQQPMVTSDPYILNLYKKYNLGDAPNLDEIEPVAITSLHEDSLIMLEAAELILTRCVDIEKEPEIKVALYGPGLTAQDRFVNLLLIRSLERKP